jgi:hypothetical protein
MNKHPVKWIHLGEKYVPVDERIIPVVKWLNSLPGVETKFSCQGDSKSRPYVLLHCSDESSLIKICNQTIIPISNLVGVVVAGVNVDANEGQIRHQLLFSCPRDLTLFLCHLAGHPSAKEESLRLWQLAHPGRSLEEATYRTTWAPPKPSVNHADL